MTNIIAHSPYRRKPVPPQSTDFPNWMGIELSNIQRAIPPLNVRLCTVDDTPTIMDDTVVYDASGGAITVTLNPPDQVAFQKWTFKKIDNSGNAVTIVGVIDGVTNPTLVTQYQAITIQSMGSAYITLASV